ncbi:hypothetical protein VDG1235_1233 [Verrucomicrobiia bacterium DG1235]|nr:hypothetical protein VDG1235_1233 [Verrucomicrobiae bacterium DG1235]
MKQFLLISIAALAGLARLEADSYEPTSWERQIIAACLVLEASNQGEIGMQAVAAVIANRGERDTSRYISIVKHPYAFSALNTASTGKTGSDGYTDHVRRASRDSNWTTALQIVDQLYARSLTDITYGADHYSRRDELPSWSHKMRATTVIGDHLFFKAL